MNELKNIFAENPFILFKLVAAFDATFCAVPLNPFEIPALPNAAPTNESILERPRLIGESDIKILFGTTEIRINKNTCSYEIRYFNFATNLTITEIRLNTSYHRIEIFIGINGFGINIIDRFNRKARTSNLMKDMNRRNIWNLVKENSQDTFSRRPTSRYRLDYDFNQQLLDVETVADAAELPPEKLSEILDEMVREESEKKNTMCGFRRLSTKLMNKMKSKHSGSSKISIIMNEKPEVPESVSSILKPTLSHHQSTTAPSEQPVFTVDEQLSVLSSSPIPVNREASSYRSSF
uniref:Uncharacterized protein n=2 Tax=Onchocerca ochengi TaxID=42157 RepID=A0A182EHX5_ONCOC